MNLDLYFHMTNQSPITVVPPPPSIIPGYVFYIDSGIISSYSGSGPVWKDLTGSGMNVTLVESPTFDPTDGGGALVFNGSSQYGTFDYNAIFDMSGAAGYCQENWVKFNNFSTGQIPFSKGIYGSSYDWGFYIPDNTTIRQWTQGTVQSLDATGLSLNTSQWYHICASGDSSNNTVIYLNGVALTSGTLTMTNADTASPTGEVAGYGPNLPTAFGLLNGRLGQCRLYQTNLTATQVLNNFNADKTRYGY